MITRIHAGILLVAASTCLAAVACSVTAPPAGDSSGTTSAAYQSAYRIGHDAYVYGLPLLVTNATFETMTSVDVSQGAYGPANQFNNVRSPNGSGSTAVVAPGATSLSSIAWLDLSSGPQVLHVPKVTGHFFVLAFIDPYAENVVNLGTASSTPEGDYVVVDPQQHDVALPHGTQRLDVDYSRMWIIGSTQLLGPDDVTTVNAIQDGYTLTPLSKYGTTYKPTPPAAPRTTVTKHEPPSGLQFFDQLGEQLALFPPPSADASILSELASVGIGPGRRPSTDTALSADTVRGLTDAVAAGPSAVQEDTQSLYAAGFRTHAGYLLGGFGTYGTDYAQRAVISQVGLGAFVSHQAMYAMAWSDSTSTALSGSAAYVLHLAAPPATAEGWSLTVYNLAGGLVQNSLNRYAFTNVSTLSKNADGSVDVYLESTQPSGAARAANWLPTPAGQGFEVTWRLFAPEPSAIPGILDGSGWQPPPVTKSD
jgi:hypothetical protein